MDEPGWRERVWSCIASGLTLGTVKPKELRKWWDRDTTDEEPIELGGPFMSHHLLSRAAAEATVLRIDDDDWPPMLTTNGEVLTHDFFFKGVHLEPLRSTEGLEGDPPQQPDGVDVVAGAFLSAVTDSAMRRQPSWVFVIREDGCLRLHVISAGSGKVLSVHGSAPDRKYSPKA